MKIKLKFILFFVPLFSLILVALSGFNIFIFHRDKIAYVFATTLENTQTAALIINAQIDAQKPLLNLLRSSFNFAQNNFPHEAKELLQLNQTLSAVKLDAWDGRRWLILDSLGEIAPGMQVTLDSLENLGQIRPVYFPENRSMWAVIQPIAMKSYKYQNYRLTVLFKSNPVTEILNQPRYFDMFMVDQTGKILLRPEQLADPAAISVLEAQGGRMIGESARTLEANVNNRDYLFAFVPVPGRSLGFASVIPKAKAVSAIEEMKRNSLGILCLLLSLGIAGVLLLIRSVTRNIESLTQSLIQFSNGNLEAQSNIKSSDETGIMSKVFNSMTQKIVSLVAKESENARMESELDTARKVQHRFVPKKDYLVKDFEIRGSFEPASECGGDWWYYLDQGDRCWLLIADVTGHGVASALMTAALRAGVAATQAIPNLTVKSFTENLNRVIHDSGQGELMATFFLGEVNLKTGRLSYVNASHCAPMLRRQDGTIEFLSLVGGPRLGEAYDSTYEPGELSLQANDILLLYTDGLSEFSAANGRMFGDKRIMKNIEKTGKNGQLPLENYRKGLTDEFEKFRAGDALPDDLTYYFFEYKFREPPGPT